MAAEALAPCMAKTIEDINNYDIDYGALTCPHLL